MNWADWSVPVVGRHPFTSCAPVNVPCLTTVRPLRAASISASVMTILPETGARLGALAHVDPGPASTVPGLSGTWDSRAG